MDSLIRQPAGNISSFRMTAVISEISELLKLCSMIWLTGIVVLLIFILCWLLVSPLVIEIDTRVPHAGLRWVSIGNARIWYENEWWLSMQILFFRKTFRLAEMKSKPKKIKNGKEKKKPGKRMKVSRVLRKLWRVVKTFRVTKWQLAVDSGDYTRNAQFYPLNFLPHTFKHMDINFRDENYLLLTIRNRPWKILFAFLR
ncbi:MAG TPA: hypothetical protein VIV35_10080 [Chitinophagaceae bacterium]